MVWCISKQTQEIVKEPEIETERTDFLWQNTIHKMLQEPLWRERDVYDTGHFLMIPLHSAFIFTNQSRINEFHQFFANFNKDYEQSNFDSLNTLSKLHFLYLASEYLVLCKKYKEPISEELLLLITTSLELIWKQPAWHWQVCKAPRFENMLSRVEWKLQKQACSYSYCRAIIDEELFAFAIAADLKAILLDQSPVFIDKMLDTAYKVFKQKVVLLNTTSERWLFQPGVWTDHPDYAYAGHNEIKIGLEKNPVPGIAEDTSHFHRFPLWLISLQTGFEVQRKQIEANYFKQLRYGLANQFLEEILVFPGDEFPNYRTTNFMNGHNGVYRYSYITQGEGKGYGPYELSGTLLLGWWSFLPDPKIKDVYCYISSSFPLSEEEIKIYLGPDTTRDRHPLIKGRAQFESGLIELINRLACQFKNAASKFGHGIDFL